MEPSAVFLIGPLREQCDGSCQRANASTFALKDTSASMLLVCARVGPSSSRVPRRLRWWSHSAPASKLHPSTREISNAVFRVQCKVACRVTPSSSILFLLPQPFQFFGEGLHGVWKQILPKYANLGQEWRKGYEKPRKLSGDREDTRKAWRPNQNGQSEGDNRMAVSGHWRVMAAALQVLIVSGRADFTTRYFYTFAPRGAHRKCE